MSYMRNPSWISRNLLPVSAFMVFGGSFAAATQNPTRAISYDSLGAAYTAAIYAIEPAHGGGYQARNARQEITARFGPDGLDVESTNGSVGLRLARGGPSEIVVSGNRIEYRHDGLIEWYVNDTVGIEQGFTFSRRPAAATRGAPLTIALAFRGAWQPEVSDGGRAIVFHSSAQAELRYAGLKAWDARGRDLPARIEVAGREIRILVDDARALYPVTVDPVLQQAKLTASDSANGSPCGSPIQCDYFGQSVSMSGNTVVVGAPGKNNTGAAYVFLRSGTTWTQQAKLTASDAFEEFGSSVSVSGDTAVVNSKSSGAGGAYVFVRSGTAWNQQAKLTSSDGGYGFISVSVSGDTVVGGEGNATGAAYVFVRSGTIWTQQAKLTASGTDSETFTYYFGSSVSVSGDTIVVAALGDPSGDLGIPPAAYVFVRSGTTWTQQAKFNGGPGYSYDGFADSVSVSADTVVAGAPGTSGGGAAYVFSRNGATWTSQATLTASDAAEGDYFGFSVSVSGDTVVAGAQLYNGRPGVAYVFGRRGTVWTQQGKLISSDPAANEFAASVSVSGDTVVVGAPATNHYSGAAYIFPITATSFPPTVTSVSPINSSGSPQTFSATYLDQAGGDDLSYTTLLFNSSFTGVGGCWIQYFHASNTVYLVNDAASDVVPGSFHAGAGGTLSNSHCTVADAGPAAIAGNNLTLPVTVTFAAGFAGSKTVYAAASTSAHLDSAWQTMGVWGSGPAQPPSVVSVSPNNSTGNRQTFTATYSDVAGATDLGYVTLLFNSSLSGVGGCWIQYHRASNALYLINDAGSGLAPGVINPGTTGTLSNTQCTIGNAGAATTSGNNLALPVTVTFSAGFAGPKTIYAAASTNAHVDSAWLTMGTWNTGAVTPPSVVSVSPINGAGSPATFTAVYSDVAGGADLGNVTLLISSSFTGAGACWIHYQRASNSMYLVNDAGSGLAAGTINPGAPGTLSNSQCTIGGAGVAAISGNNLTLPLSITFAAGFSGTKTVYGAASTNAHVDGNWQSLGTWTPH